jgi:hypothetical protein
MYDLLNDGGVLAVVDLDPKKVKNNLIVSTFRKWAFEVTEPHIYEYYNTNMDLLLKNQGFEYVTAVSNDPINTIWLGKKESKGCAVYDCNDCVSNSTVVKKSPEFFCMV